MFIEAPRKSNQTIILESFDSRCCSPVCESVCWQGVVIFKVILWSARENLTKEKQSSVVDVARD